jgi:hypothetical protein
MKKSVLIVVPFLIVSFLLILLRPFWLNTLPPNRISVSVLSFDNNAYQVEIVDLDRKDKYFKVGDKTTITLSEKIKGKISENDILSFYFTSDKSSLEVYGNEIEIERHFKISWF